MTCQQTIDYNNEDVLYVDYHPDVYRLEEGDDGTYGDIVVKARLVKNGLVGDELHVVDTGGYEWNVMQLNQQDGCMGIELEWDRIKLSGHLDFPGPVIITIYYPKEATGGTFL